MRTGEVGLDGLAGRTALIAGANQRIGWAIAEAFSASRARIVVNYPDESRYPGRLAELESEAPAIAAGAGNLGDIEGMFGVLDERGIDVKSWSIKPASFPNCALEAGVLTTGSRRPRWATASRLISLTTVA